MSVIHGHLRPDQLAFSIVSMVETYNDLDNIEDQSERDQLSDEIAISLEDLIVNQGLEEAFHTYLPNAVNEYLGV